MSVPLYVPVLPTRPHAVSAYRALPPDLQRRIALLWTLPPRPGFPPGPLAQLIRKEAGGVSAVHRRGSGWLDAPFADEVEAEVLSDTLAPEWWEHRNLWPVTGPGRPGAQQSLALAAAGRREGGRLGCVYGCSAHGTTARSRKSSNYWTNVRRAAPSTCSLTSAPSSRTAPMRRRRRCALWTPSSRSSHGAR